MSSDQREEIAVQEEDGKSLNRNSSFIGDKKKLIVGAVGLIIILIAGFAFYQRNATEQELEASLALSRIKTYVDAGEFQKALSGDPSKKVRGNEIVGLESIVTQYEPTNAGKSAALLAGVSLTSLNKYAEAENYFKIASKSSADIVSINGLLGHASCLENNKNYEEAVSIYEKALGKSEKSGSKDKVLYLMGLCFERMGKSDLSSKYLVRLVNEFEFSEYSGDAKVLLGKNGTVLE